MKRELEGSNTQEVLNYVIPIDKYISENGIKFMRKVFEETNIKYSKIFDDDYFSEIIGVTNYLDKAKVNVKLKIHSSERFRIIDSKPPHWTWLTIKESREYSIVEMNLKLNNELENFILQYSPDIEVIEPIELKENVKNKLKLGLDRYTN